MAVTVGSSALATRPSLAAGNGGPANAMALTGGSVWVHTFAAIPLARVSLAPLQGSAAVVVDGRSNSCQTIVADAAARTLALDGRTIAAWQQCEVSAQSPLSVSAWPVSETNPIARAYDGEFRLALSGGRLVMVNVVPLETYVAATLVAEASPSWALEATKAQAIAVRSFAVRAAAGRQKRGFDVTDDTSSQVYRGREGLNAQFQAAALATAGQVLVWQGAPAAVYYSATCGGHTAAVEEIGGAPVAYLAGVADGGASGTAYCAPAPYFHWRNVLSTATLSRIFDAPADAIENCAVVQRYPDGRAKMLALQTDGRSRELSGRDFYERCLTVMGYKVVPSTLFELQFSSAGAELTGHGIGHGVGLCQWGARGRADAGFKAAEILAAYFPGTALARTSVAG